MSHSYSPSTRFYVHEIQIDQICRFDVPHDCSVELSPQGYQFFTDIFETFDKVWTLKPTLMFANNYP